MNRDFISDSNFVLRKIFNSESNIDVLQDFIETILDIKISKITPTKFFEKKDDSVQTKEIQGIATVRVVTEEGEELNIGIQIIDGGYIQEKILIFGATIHANQQDCDEDLKIAKTITINILDLDYFSTLAPHKIIKLIGRGTSGEKKEGTEFHIIELPKFEKSELESREDAWIAYLKGDDEDLMERAKDGVYPINKLDKLLTIYWNQEILD